MFCCTTLTKPHSSEKAQAAHEAAARHNRTASVILALTPPPRAYVVDRPPSWHAHMQEEEAPPPAYEAAVRGEYASPAGMAYGEKSAGRGSSASEKEALAVAYAVEEEAAAAARGGGDGIGAGNGNGNETENGNGNEEAEHSDASSVVSTPSTQITGLGSMYTGRTIRRSGGGDGDGRLSDEYSTRPPSYYAGSIDRRSSISSTATGRVLRHPVMRDDWFENLQGRSQSDSRSMYGD